MPRSIPPLFDLQVNGFAGVDFQSDALTCAEMRRAVYALRSPEHQTHRIFVTLVSDSIDALGRRFEKLEAFRAEDPIVSETVCGYHLEGPFLNPEEGYRGAHRAEVMRAPDAAAFLRLQSCAGGRIQLVTIAPEWPGSAEFISEVTAAGVVVSLGHTNASEKQIDEAIQAGATLCTHLGNGVPQQLPRHDNVVQRLLARDELTACFIPDGVHLPRFALRNFFKAKPSGKAIFTTDAVSAAGAPDGFYTVGKARVESRRGAVREPGAANLAGSCLSPRQGVKNVSEWLGLAEEEARALFSTVPAALFELNLPTLVEYDHGED